MEQAMNGLAMQLMSHIVVPMFGSMLVIIVAMIVVLAPVRSRFVRGLGAYAAMFVWLAWMATYYKVI